MGAKLLALRPDATGATAGLFPEAQLKRATSRGISNADAGLRHGLAEWLPQSRRSTRPGRPQPAARWPRVRLPHSAKYADVATGRRSVTFLARSWRPRRGEQWIDKHYNSKLNRFPNRAPSKACYQPTA